MKKTLLRLSLTTAFLAIGMNAGFAADEDFGDLTGKGAASSDSASLADEFNLEELNNDLKNKCHQLEAQLKALDLEEASVLGGVAKDDAEKAGLLTALAEVKSKRIHVLTAARVNAEAFQDKLKIYLDDAQEADASTVAALTAARVNAEAFQAKLNIYLDDAQEAASRS